MKKSSRCKIIYSLYAINYENLELMQQRASFAYSELVNITNSITNTLSIFIVDSSLKNTTSTKSKKNKKKYCTQNCSRKTIAQKRLTPRSSFTYIHTCTYTSAWYTIHVHTYIHREREDSCVHVPNCGLWSKGNASHTRAARVDIYRVEPESCRVYTYVCERERERRRAFRVFALSADASVHCVALLSQRIRPIGSYSLSIYSSSLASDSLRILGAYVCECLWDARSRRLVFRGEVVSGRLFARKMLQPRGLDNFNGKREYYCCRESILLYTDLIRRCIAFDDRMRIFDSITVNIRMHALIYSSFNYALVYT